MEYRGECPRCGSTEFREFDCGPDGYDDDITYTSYKCEKCGLWFDGWVDKWYKDVDCWQDVEDAEEFIQQGGSNEQQAQCQIEGSPQSKGQTEKG